MNDDEHKSDRSGIHIGEGVNIQGDVFSGGKHTQGVSIGSINNVTGGQVNVAAGDMNVSQTVNDALTIAEAFERMNQSLQALPDGPMKTMAYTAVQGLQSEAEKGEAAEEKSVEQWFGFLAKIAPDILEVAAATFINPIAGLGTAFKKIAERAQGGSRY